MAVGKNKKFSKGKKGSKKKPVDAFAKKDWYNIRVPAVFQLRDAGKTVVNRTQGNKMASDGLMRRVVEFNQQDLTHDSSIGYKKFKLIVEDVQGRDCITNFHSMSITSDRIWSLVKKGQSTIEAFVDFKTKDGYHLRFFVMCFVAKRKNQVKKTSYAKTTQVKAIRRIMREFIVEKFSNGSIKNVMQDLIPNHMADEVAARCKSIKQIKDFTIRKVKVLKAPKVDRIYAKSKLAVNLVYLVTRLREIHADGGAADTVTKGGAVVSSFEPPIQDVV